MEELVHFWENNRIMRRWLSRLSSCFCWTINK